MDSKNQVVPARGRNMEAAELMRAISACTSLIERAAPGLRELGAAATGAARALETISRHSPSRRGGGGGSATVPDSPFLRKGGFDPSGVAGGGITVAGITLAPAIGINASILPEDTGAEKGRELARSIDRELAGLWRSGRSELRKAVGR